MLILVSRKKIYFFISGNKFRKKRKHCQTFCSGNNLLQMELAENYSKILLSYSDSAKAHLCCFMRKANHSTHKSSGLCFVQLLRYLDNYGQSRQVIENLSKCSIDNTNKFCTEVGEFINKNHSRRPQVICVRPRSKHQTIDFF